MIRHRHHGSTRGVERLPTTCVVALAALAAVLAVAAAGTAGPVAATAQPTAPTVGAPVSPVDVDQNGTASTDAAPPDAVHEVEVRPRSPDSARVRVELTYEARSEAELRRARNGTLDPGWFRGAEIVEAAMAERGEDTEGLEMRRTSAAVPREDERTIRLRHRTIWTGVMDDADRVEIGPDFAAVMEDGDVFRAAVETNVWANWTASADEPETTSHALDVYAWTIGADGEPRLALHREDYRPGDETDSRLAPPLPLVAPIAVLLAMAAVRTRRH